MEEAWVSSMISSTVLILRASSMSCWPSMTVMPAFCSANSTGGSTMSMATGSPARPRWSSSSLIQRATCSARPISGLMVPRSIDTPGRERFSPSSQGA